LGGPRDAHVARPVKVLGPLSQAGRLLGGGVVNVHAPQLGRGVRGEPLAHLGAVGQRGRAEVCLQSHAFAPSPAGSCWMTNYDSSYYLFGSFQLSSISRRLAGKIVARRVRTFYSGYWRSKYCT